VFDYINYVLIAWITALPEDSIVQGESGAWVERIGNADESSRGEPGDRCRGNFSVVFERPYKNVVSFFPFVGTQVDRGALRQLRDVSDLILHCTVIQLADETLTPNWSQSLRRPKLFRPLRRCVRLNHTKN
jgi:hypothetical protein